jgi:hypothetical protein
MQPIQSQAEQYSLPRQQAPPPSRELLATQLSRPGITAGLLDLRETEDMLRHGAAGVTPSVDPLSEAPNANARDNAVGDTQFSPRRMDTQIAPAAMPKPPKLPAMPKPTSSGSPNQLQPLQSSREAARFAAAYWNRSE